MYHCLIVILIPLSILIYFYTQQSSEEGDDIKGYEESHIVFIRQLLASAMLIATYYIMLRRYKIQFVKGELHLRNENSVTDMMQKISEPVIIIKKNKRHMNPRFKNTAAQDILPLTEEVTPEQVEDDTERVDRVVVDKMSSLGSDNESDSDGLDMSKRHLVRHGGDN